jgi:hypothetical protein
MRLVHRDHADAGPAQQPGRAGARQPFRSHVEKPKPPVV